MRWSESEIERKALVLSGQSVLANMRANRDVSLVGWAMENGLFVRIDRSTRWGNPFVTGTGVSREDVIQQHAVWLESEVSLQKQLSKLRGKVLGCWCFPRNCHGENYLKALELLKKENLNG